MVGNFKRDRSPFVLTPDMVYVINGCEKKPTEKFHAFVDLCCKGKQTLIIINRYSPIPPFMFENNVH